VFFIGRIPSSVSMARALGDGRAVLVNGASNWPSRIVKTSASTSGFRSLPTARYRPNVLKMRLFGGFEVELDGVPVEPPASRRAWALLAWLALHPGLSDRRGVAANFWPDVLDSSARASLRSAIWALRRALGPAADAYLRVTHDFVGLDPGDQLWVDTAAFHELVAAGRLPEAAALAEGEFLAGLDDEWVLQAREELHMKLTRVFERLAVQAEDRGDLDAALGWTRRQVSLNPLAEGPQRRLMRRLAADGDRAAALAGYARFRDRLGRELGLGPSAATRRLAVELSEPPEVRPRVADHARALPLVGRDRELQQLLAAWRGARAGAGAVVTITGEPGIGKTRLAAELLERARAEGAHTASCAALDLGGGAPLAMWAELIGDLTADLETAPLDAAWPSALGALVPDLERRLGREPSPRATASPDLERARLFEATVALLEWVGRRPLVLLLEDIQAADNFSLELAGHVGRRAARLPVLIVLTRRPFPRRAQVDALEHALRTRGALVCELSLARLPSMEIVRLARHVAPLADSDLDQVVTAADGNALVAVEWARARARGQQEPPASLRGVVRAALAPLSTNARQLADFVAVAGRDLALPEIEALEIEAPADSAASALDSGLLTTAGGRVGYRHALLREAAYHDLPELRRVTLHAVLASVLAGRGGQEASRFAAEAARHFRLAGRGEFAAEQLVRAAAHARSVGAFTEAAAVLAEAAELAPARGDLLIELAEVEAWRGHSDASEAAFARAVETLQSAAPEEVAGAWARRANWNRGALCHPRLVRDSARTAIEILDSAGVLATDVRVEALAAWAWAEAVAGDVEAADALLSRVHEVLGTEPGGELLTCWVEHARALSLVRRGRFRASYAPQIAAGEAAERAGRPDLGNGCWWNAACAAACAGDLTRALEFVDRGLAALRGSGLGTLEVQLLAARAHVLMRMARLGAARAASEAERALAERLDNAALQATSEHDRGLVAMALGEFAQAERLLATALIHDAPVSRPLARLARAEALIRLGRNDEAEQELRATALEPVRPGDMPDTLVPRLTRLQGLIAAGRGDPALAERRLREASDGWRRLLGAASEGDRYTAALADLGRPPVAGLVEPARELDLVLADLASIHVGSA
jgi:DNA-binding SARP family transcriptional activator/tetratricopeptide (TPR) repeat protein